MDFPTDLGCQQTGVAAALPAAAFVIVLFLLLAGLGSAVGGSRRWVAADLISGWGVLAIIFTLGGIFFPGSLPFCAGIAGVAAIAAIIAYTSRHKSTPWPFWLLLALLLQIWILALINHAGISGWDDIGEWTPNALYLWRHDAFPNASLPLSYSIRPAYPYALAYLGYAASLMNGAFVVQASAMISWLLLTSFAWALTEFEEKQRPGRLMFLRLGCALLLVTLFNPGFNASFSITGQSDAATSGVVGFLGLLLLRLYTALCKKDRDKKTRAQMRALTWQIATTAIVLTFLRNMNIVLPVFFGLGFLLLTLRKKCFGPAMRILIPAFLPTFIFFLLWHTYSSHGMPHDDTPDILPWAQWRWALLPQLLRAAGMEMLKKNGFYALMLGTSGFGLWALFRGKLDKFGALAVLTAVVFFGYYGFILTAFIGSTFFTEYNVAHAMSFYRYGTHTGLLGVAMLWFLYEKYLEPRLKHNTLIPLAIFSIALLPLTYAVKPSWLVPQPSAAICAARTFGDEIAKRLPPQSHLAILDPTGNGFEPFIVNLELALDDLKTGHQSRVVASTNMFEPEKLSRVLGLIKAGGDINTVLLRRPTDELKRAFNLTGNKTTTLLLRQGKGWQPVDLSPDSLP